MYLTIYIAIFQCGAISCSVQLQNNHRRTAAHNQKLFDIFLVLVLLFMNFYLTKSNTQMYRLNVLKIYTEENQVEFQLSVSGVGNQQGRL